MGGILHCWISISAYYPRKLRIVLQGRPRPSNTAREGGRRASLRLFGCVYASCTCTRPRGGDHTAAPITLLRPAQLSQLDYLLLSQAMLNPGHAHQFWVVSMNVGAVQPKIRLTKPHLFYQIGPNDPTLMHTTASHGRSTLHVKFTL